MSRPLWIAPFLLAALTASAQELDFSKAREGDWSCLAGTQKDGTRVLVRFQVGKTTDAEITLVEDRVEGAVTSRTRTERTLPRTAKADFLGLEGATSSKEERRVLGRASACTKLAGKEATGWFSPEAKAPGLVLLEKPGLALELWAQGRPGEAPAGRDPLPFLAARLLAASDVGHASELPGNPFARAAKGDFVQLSGRAETIEVKDRAGDEVTLVAKKREVKVRASGPVTLADYLALVEPEMRAPSLALVRPAWRRVGKRLVRATRIDFSVTLKDKDVFTSLWLSEEVRSCGFLALGDRLMQAHGDAQGALVGETGEVPALLVNEAAPAPDPIDTAELLAAASSWKEKLAQKRVSWTSRHVMRAGGEVLVRRVLDLHAAPSSRIEALIQEKRGLRELFRIVERDGVWLAREGVRQGRCRPFEAPLSTPGAYGLIRRSDLVLVTEELLAGTSLEGRDAKTFRFRQPLSEDLRARISAGLSRRRPGDKNPGLDALAELVEKGELLTVDVATGIVTGRTGPAETTTIGELKADEVVLNDEAFVVEGGEKWPSLLADPTKGDKDDLLLVGQDEGWQPGVPHNPEVRLLSVSTGDQRRVPFRGESGVPGAFVRNRTQAVVAGGVTFEETGLFVVDLSSGENRRLGGGLLDGGLCIGTQASPDGKSLATCHVTPHGTRVAVVDLASGRARYVTGPIRPTGIAWTPDGIEILLVEWSEGVVASPALHRLEVATGKDSKVMDAAERPILLAEKMLLFWDPNAASWSVANLDGSARRKVPLAGINDVVLSPDGKRLLAVKIGQTGTSLVVKDGFEGKETPLPGELRGVSSWPVWR